jgi:hypothetical protein
MSAFLALILGAVFLPTAAGQAALAGAPHQAGAAQQTTAAGGARPSGGAGGHAHAFWWPGHHRATATGASPADSSGGNLRTYTGTVQHNPTFYAIFWLPPNAHFEADSNGDSNYENLMARYLKDSDKTTLANIVAQYHDRNGDNILPHYTYGGSWRDTTTYPHNGSSFDPLVDSNYQDAVNRALAANPSWQDGVNSTFFVFTGWAINSCNGDPSVNGCTPAVDTGLVKAYCAYHSYFIDANGHRAVYVNMPDETSVLCPGTGALPNGDIYADAEFSPLAHEQFEAMTDPLPGQGLTDSSGQEIADKCVDSIGDPNFGYTDPDWGYANQNVNGDKYQVQQLWSNADGGCFGSYAGPTGYYATYGDYVADDASSTGEINLAKTALVPSVNCCLAPNPTIDWGDGTSSGADVTPSACVVCTLVGSHAYVDWGDYTVTVTYWTGCCISYSTTLHIFVFEANKPVPTTTGLQPNVVQAGGASDTTLTVNGSGFVGGSTVQLNGTALTTTYVSDTQLTATIPASMLATPTTADITVLNGSPGGGTSNPQTLFVPLTGAQVSASQSMSGTNPQAALTGLSANATGAGTLTVAQYTADPGATCCRVGTPSGSSYFDVHAAAGNSFSAVTIRDCNLGGGSQVLWYNTSTATWAPASKQSYDASTGCATVTVDSTTQPSLAQLAGLPLGVANLPPVWQPTAAQTQDYHDTLSFGLKATDAEPGDALTLSVDSGSSLPAGLSLTDHGDGTGTVAGTLTAAAGDYPVTFDVSDGVNPPVQQTVTIHVGHEQTTLTYTGDTAIAQGGTANLSAVLQEDGSTAPVPAGQTVTLAVGSGSSAQSCQGTTDSTGTASCQISPLTQALGNQVLSASFAGDTFYQPASAGASALTFTTTTLTYTGATSGNYDDAATLAATLVDHAGAPVANEPVVFSLNNGAETCANTTDSAGHASCAVTPKEATGPYTLSISFVGDTTHKPSNTATTFTVTPEETTLTYTGAALIANNRPATLSAILKEDGSGAPAPAGQTVTLAVGSGAGAQSCQAQTAADGTVSCPIATVNQPLGNQPVSATFAGDSHYAASADSSQQRLVFSYLPAGGGFALGDKAVAAATASTTLTWWGSQWATLNPLSGGAAPTSFKGFAQKFSSGTDPVCGGTWTTVTGNSTVPPASVPTYMAVVVPSKVTQSGTTTLKISGTIARIVIVKTNPGYQPDPSHAGTGTVVATLCGS